MHRRAALAASAAALLTLLAGCAQVGSTAPADAATGHWSGRMSLRVDSAPPQSFSAFFDLRGNPRAGELQLTSPIGSTLGLARWTPREATLQTGSDIRQFDSAEAMIEAATGAAIPLDALFAWLDGRQQAVPGWRPDLSQVQAGRLQAVRESPTPTADLRIVFERP
ncbi:lipoprotein insertase outer membrane protein LolB [Variovorax sp. OV329]|uniref:lipoprotein insertase outer membrane protein LolB n=1 Tax=Variovorax sp. OV329 TaxID=1882825 RepID=UPI0008EE3FA0|nr:lipoprotein insertase outer membrane protein LolB [Variovorax sp. OV329]SFM89192.1 outer membrane lipoprotein LolB [Variovorax sp. OV329]